MPALIVLVLVGVAIYLYGLLIYWLFAAVAPEFIVLGSVLGTAAAPVLYGMVAYNVLNRNTWRKVLWWPLFALLGLLYVDLAYVVLAVVAQIVHAQSTQGMRSILEAIALLPISRLGAQVYPGTFLDPAMLTLYMVPGVLFKGVLIVTMQLLIRGFLNDQVDTTQPAYLQYFFRQAAIDVRSIAEETIARFISLVTLASDWIVRASTGRQLMFIWPLTITAYLALLAPTFAAAAALLILLSVQAVGILAVCAVTMIISAILFCVERAVMLARSGFAKCPHAGCHVSIPLPYFYCPECGAEHTRLLPGKCGALFRACTCRNALLPTTFWLGKGRLRSACPQCKKPLTHELFAGSAHVPIYGATSAGKTMFMMSATWQLVEKSPQGIEAEFINAADRRSYDIAWKPGFESGQVREKTRQKMPDAFLLSIQRPSGLPVSLYMYDPAGEAIEHSSEIEGHRFLKYIDGLALLIDPFSLPSFVRAYQDAGFDLPVAASTADPVEVVNRVVNVLESQSDLHRGRRMSRRVAVVLTKCDVPQVQQQFGISLDDEKTNARWRDFGADNDGRLQDWLRSNEPDLWQLLQGRFENLRFFAVSSLGHDPSQAGTFVPRNVVSPLCWLLANRVALTTPLVGRIGGRAMEIAAAAAVIAAFFLPVALAAEIAVHAGTRTNRTPGYPGRYHYVAAPIPSPRSEARGRRPEVHLPKVAKRPDHLALRTTPEAKATAHPKPRNVAAAVPHRTELRDSPIPLATASSACANLPASITQQVAPVVPGGLSPGDVSGTHGVVRIEVNSSGSITYSNIEQSTGNGQLDSAMLDAAILSKYAPAQVNCAAAPGRIDVNEVFP